MSSFGWIASSAVVLALVGTLLVGPASAQVQDIAFRWDCPAEAKTVQPASSPETWSCTAEIQYKSAGSGFTDPQNPLIMGIEFPDHPSWMLPVASPPQITTIGPFPQGEFIDFPIDITVSVTRDAPAFETENLWVRPYVIQNPRPEGDLSKVTTRSQLNLSVTPGYVSSYTAHVVTPAQETRPPDPLRYTVEIDNFSNGATRFDFAMVSNQTGGFTPLVPEPLVVPGAQPGASLEGGNATENGTGEANASQQPAGSQGTVTFDVQTPLGSGYANERRPLQLGIESSFAPDPSVRGVSSVVTVVAQARGLYVPGPTAPLLALALVGAAVLMTRRRTV